MPNFGTFEYTSIQECQAAAMLEYHADYISAVGHKGTVDVINSILEQYNNTLVTCNRLQVFIEVGDQAIIFKPVTRLKEGVVLTSKELKQVECEWGLSRRIK